MNENPIAAQCCAIRRGEDGDHLCGGGDTTGAALFRVRQQGVYLCQTWVNFILVSLWILLVPSIASGSCPNIRQAWNKSLLVALQTSDPSSNTAVPGTIA